MKTFIANVSVYPFYYCIRCQLSSNEKKADPYEVSLIKIINECFYRYVFFSFIALILFYLLSFTNFDNIFRSCNNTDPTIHAINNLAQEHVLTSSGVSNHSLLANELRVSINASLLLFNKSNIIWFHIRLDFSLSPLVVVRTT